MWGVFNFNRTYPIRATGRGTYWGVSGMGDVYKRNQKLVEQIRSGDQYAFEQMFHSYYSKLCVFSNSYVKSLDVSRDVVQEVFIKIWDNREDFTINQSLKAYLYQAVRNHSLNHIDKQNHRRRLRSEEHTSELQSRGHLVCRLLLEKKNKQHSEATTRHTST